MRRATASLAATMWLTFTPQEQHALWLSTLAGMSTTIGAAFAVRGGNGGIWAPWLLGRRVPGGTRPWCSPTDGVFAGDQAPRRWPACVSAGNSHWRDDAAVAG